MRTKLSIDRLISTFQQWLQINSLFKRRLATRTNKSLAASAQKPYNRSLLSDGFQTQRLFSSSFQLSSKNGSFISNSPVKKITRQLEAELAEIEYTDKLAYLDAKYRLITPETKKVLDIGFSPGHWMNYVVEQMCELHNVAQDKLYTKDVMILGFDLLFKNPPAGTSSIQGNIFSKFAQALVVNHFKECEFKQRKKRMKDLVEKEQEPAQKHQHQQRQQQKQQQQQRQIEEDEIRRKSYFDHEQEEHMIETDLAESLRNLSISESKLQPESTQKNILVSDDAWKVDLVLSDLSRPLRQVSGYYDRTETYPYIRSNTNKGLNHHVLNPQKANLDLGEASIILMKQVLRRGGSFVLRLQDVNGKDAEFIIMRLGLEKMFEKVVTIEVGAEVILVCSVRK